MKRKTLIALVIGSVLFTIGLMIFGSHGSLKPTELGFYTSIAGGLIWFAAMYYAVRKFWRNP